ncbi:MAG TPA: hypothetical protein VKL22_00265, partial [Actinomycetota bacterium]|nr:hypothetical protein [Actinomycetota bacterium]
MPRRRAIGPAPRWLVFAGMAGAAALAQVLPPGIGRPLTYLIEPLAAVAILIGARFYRPANGRAWMLAACAAAASVAAPALAAVPRSAGVMNPAGAQATAQVLSLVAYLPLLAALLMFTRARIPAIDREG